MSWVPLTGSDSPPFTGDPGALEGTATSLGVIASDLRNQASLLQGYINDTGSWTGEAKDACVKTISHLPGQLASAGLKYQGASEALRPYASALRNAMAKAESLRGQAEGAQRDVEHFSDALRDQRNWERAENTRAHNAAQDPSQGSPVPAQWPGGNNAALLHSAQSQLDGLRHQLNIARDDLESAANTARLGIDAAANVVRDDGGLIGAIKNAAADIRRATKQFVEFCAANGMDLAALSETLGALSGWLAIVAMLPIPGAQIFGLVGTAVGLVGMAASLTLVVAGEKSFKSWAKENGPGLVFSAASGLRAVALARNATKAGEVSTVAKNLVNQGAKSGSTFKSAGQLLDDADKFQLGAFKNQALKFLSVKPDVGKFTGLKLDTFGTKLLTGQVGGNSAMKVIKMSVSGPIGVVGGAGYLLDKGNEVRETYNHLVEAKDTALAAVGVRTGDSE